ncbi:response regulator [Sandaracinus amylolyticus]|uniref:PAS/PAC sensor hybrid histidine kinase n=1 Tax=Sandaracinus amylolyticus TaxID=927083 RepID=A0A0F6YKB0_9BACT|nr:response regulator [Sandaracinus amylolyticus]AKF08663.1 PAS/PAC sensor hybrid histidine kinase [Sandaracinus amylolyticus]
MPAASSATYPVVSRAGRAVLVEDHDDLRDAITEWLESAGWVVRAYASADAALLSVRSELPDVVVTDFNTGTLSGPALARELRLDPSTRGVAIVGMSGSLEPSPAMLRFFDAFLPKPVVLAELEALMRRASTSR